jgi:crotonobetainyl-CoA:carnitine CoA-transferase CaiB-like acyl-CoA transferase
MTSDAALREIAYSIGLSDITMRSVRIEGDADPIVQSLFKIGAAGAAAISASGLAAADLWNMRTGRRQGVSIDRRQAAAGMRSGNYLKLNGIAIPEKYNAIMGTYRTRDGRWAYIHTNFPQQRAAALRVLGCEENRDAVVRAFHNWNALDFEEALLAAKGVGGAVRTMAEWQAHPQAAAIAELPLIDIIRIGDSAPEPLRGGTRPLSNVRAIDVTRLIAGPSCARTLAEHGADVMKISARHLPDFGVQEFDVGHGKLSAYVDLRDAAEAETLRNLVRESDIFLQSYRPGALSGLGFAPEDLVSIRPGLIYVSLSAFGHVGPWNTRRGYDTVIQAMSGMAARQSELDGVDARPRFNPAPAIDYCTGYILAAGAMAALRRRAEEGGSWLVRMSLAQVGRWLVAQGEVDPDILADIPKDFPNEELNGWLTATQAPQGLLEHLRPVVRMSETPPFWNRPAVPLGYHRPQWPLRENWVSPAG